MSTSPPDSDVDPETDRTEVPTDRPSDGDGDTDSADASNDSDDSTANATPTRAELVARVELLEAENSRLRDEYGQVRQSQYRNRALGLAAIGLVAIGGAFVFTDVRDVLVALGATGLFGALLTYYLSPETFVAADIGERVYASLARNHVRIVAALGLGDDRVYVPTPERGSACQLFVPRHQEYQRPTEGDDGPFVTTADARGLLLEPSGASLVTAFERGLTDPVATAPASLSTQLADALVEQFELAARVEPAADPTRVTFAITDSAFGDLDRFDHPIASFLAVGLAIGLERPITLEVTAGDDRTDWLVTCRWDERSDESTPSEPAASDEASQSEPASKP